GVGGLLMEIVTRPQPRAEPPAVAGRRIAAVVLAAGRSTRMGGPNKLLAEIRGRPLVRIVVDEAVASHAKPVIVVGGHERGAVEVPLEGKAALVDVDTPEALIGVKAAIEEAFSK